MAATSLKLPDDLKQRITDLVEGTGQTAHGFMVEAIEQAAERAVLRRRFSAEALEAEADALRTGKAYAADEVFEYLAAKAPGYEGDSASRQGVAAVILTARAVADLERIFEFVAASDPKRALAVTECLRDAIGVLTRHPMVGRRVEDGMRELVAGRGNSTYLARYRWYPDSEQVLVLAIRHAREAGYHDE